MNSLKSDVAFMVGVILRAIMGRCAETENTIEEVLADKYTVERMSAIISDNNEVFILDMLGQMGGNRTVCRALNKIPGSGEEKKRFIFRRVWRELTLYNQ